MLFQNILSFKCGLTAFMKKSIYTLKNILRKPFILYEVSDIKLF